MRLVGLLRVDVHAPTVRHGLGGKRRAGLRVLEVAEQLLDPLGETVADPAADADDHAGRLVPVAEVVHERVARRGLHGLLAADDVPAERMVGAVDELLVHAVDEVPRRVEVHVHLLDDHALLAVDLPGVELRVAEHVDDHVERHVAVLGGALDVVARVLLARERVELAADRVDLAGDVARGRPPLGALEEHVLGEVRDPVRLGGLVARAGGEHHEARHRLRLRHRRGQQPEAVREGLAFEGGHASILAVPRSNVSSVVPTKCGRCDLERAAAARPATGSELFQMSPAFRIEVPHELPVEEDVDRLVLLDR